MEEEPIKFFKNELEKYVEQSVDEEWKEFRPQLKEVSFKKGSVIFPNSKICLDMLFISKGIGLYFRKRLLENLLEDKMFISIKSMGIDSKLDFLYSEYPEIIHDVSWKKIANFLGVTPQWLSKKINNRRYQ